MIIKLVRKVTLMQLMAIIAVLGITAQFAANKYRDHVEQSHQVVVQSVER